MTRILPVLLCALSACRADATGGTDTFGTPTPTDTDATFIPASFGVQSARFALTDDGSIGPTEDGTWAVTVELVAESGDRCTARFEGTTPLPQPELAEAPTNALVTVPRPDAAPTGSCGDADAPDVWGDPLAVLDAWAWDLALTEQASADAIDGLSETQASDLGPYLLGGGIHIAGFDGDGDGVEDQDVWHPVAIAWAEDANGTLILREDVLVGGELQPGTYVVQPQAYLSPARALLNPL